MEETIPTPCIDCRRALEPGAQKCAECGARQNRALRFIYRIGAVLAGVATLASVITAGVALWPQAMAALAPDPRPSLYQFVFDSPDPRQRNLGSFGLLNGGNLDAFVLKIEFEPIDERLSGVPSRSIKISEWVKQAEAIEKRIGDPRRALRGQQIPPRAISTTDFVDLAKAMAANGGFEGRCFFLHPYNAWAGIDAPTDRPFRNAEATMTLRPLMHYTTVREREKPRITPIDGLYVEGTLFLRPSCFARVDALPQ